MLKLEVLWLYLVKNMGIRSEWSVSVATFRLNYVVAPMCLAQGISGFFEYQQKLALLLA
ncbi:MAG: Uncharacterised protein [Porticoccaceae bacterium UBA1117]|nr:MAG: Uncharacterised protein [Porticoccaceae bacterium UBA1117]